MVQRLCGRKGGCKVIRISQIKLRPGQTEQALEGKIRKTLALSADAPLQWQIFKKSLDARKKPDLYEIYTVDVEVKNEEKLLKRCKHANVQRAVRKNYQMPMSGTENLKTPPVVIGCGPAGLFCTYLLAKAGYRPLLLERGKCVEERMADVEAFWKNGVLDPQSNVQFGEGGAGTFSDGKLNTLVKDKEGRNRFVLETFAAHGASPKILFENKPHIGTDVLVEIMKSMRREICRLGGEIRFGMCVTDFEIETKGTERHLNTLIVNGKECMPVQAVVLAPGHSARDTFSTLYQKEVPMEAKSFAVGVRAEHLQTEIDFSQYGKERGDLLPPASYKLTANLENGRGVYTFCMCPGGYVVNASSEEGKLAVNGMSYSDRSGSNANSAVVVTITPEDYGTETPLDGVAFQRDLEEKAYLAGGGKIPVQRYDDFCKDQKSTGFGKVLPQMKGGYAFANLRDVFPENLSQALISGIRQFGQHLKGFSDGDTVLSGVESRTSSPVRILRGETLESAVEGLYPCGEGAGYAGGITSAAMDGMKVAEALIRRYAPPDGTQTHE